MKPSDIPDMVKLIADSDSNKLREALADHMGVLTLYQGQYEALQSITVMRLILDELERRELKRAFQ